MTRPAQRTRHTRARGTQRRPTAACCCSQSEEGPGAKLVEKVPTSMLTWAAGAEFSASLAPISHPVWHQAGRVSADGSPLASAHSRSDGAFRARVGSTPQRRRPRNTSRRSIPVTDLRERTISALARNFCPIAMSSSPFRKAVSSAALGRWRHPASHSASLSASLSYSQWVRPSIWRRRLGR